MRMMYAQVARSFRPSVTADMVITRQYTMAAASSSQVPDARATRVTAPHQSRFSTQQVRRMSITENLMGKATSVVDGRKEKQFKEMLDAMIKAPKWTLRNWKATMDAQLDSWTMWVPGVSSSNEVKELKSFKELLDACSPAELDNPALIKGPQRDRIATSTGKPLDEVQKLMFYYKQSVVIATWLQMKKNAKEKLPTTEVELNNMQAADQRMKTIAAKVMKGDSKHAKTGRGRKLPF